MKKTLPNNYEVQFGVGAPSSDVLRLFRDFHPFGDIKNPIQVWARLIDKSKKHPLAFFKGVPVAAFVGQVPSARWNHLDVELLQCREVSDSSVAEDVMVSFLREVPAGLEDAGFDVFYAYSSPQKKQTGRLFDKAGWERIGLRPSTNDTIRLVWPDGREKEIPRQTMNALYGSSSADDLNAGIGLKRPLPINARAERGFDGGKVLHAVAITLEGEEWADWKDLVLSRIDSSGWRAEEFESTCMHDLRKKQHG